MSKMDDLISGINPSKKSPTKEQLWEFVRESLAQLGDINDYYRKLHEGEGDKESIVAEIESRYDRIKQLYDQLFAEDASGKTTADDLKSKIEEIRDYHAKLLTDEDSIKDDIDDSQKHINDFYNFLFDDKDGASAKTKKAIEEITQFHEWLTNKTDGVKPVIDKLHTEIVDKHIDLFHAAKGKMSRVDEVEEHMESISAFQLDLEKEVKPEIETRRKDLKDLEDDLRTKRKEVDSLLSDATAKSLAEGYLESMEEYSQKKPLALKKIQIEWKGGGLGTLLFNLYAFFFNHIFRYAGGVLNYLVFILPLVLICLIFIESDAFISWLQINHDAATFTGLEYTFYKTMVSLPLLWIAWFGQRNIAQRKRLFEEYNHKLRVVQMYLMFVTSDTSYPLEAKGELEQTLLEVIKRNPAEHLGKGETMIDHMLMRIRESGTLGKIKDELLKEIKEKK